MRALWYFAYGSNLDPSIFEGRRKMRPLDARPARLAGYRLVFNLPVGRGERGVANLEADLFEAVHGVAYRIPSEDAERLDRSEGVHRGYYRRVAVQVVTPAGERLEAFSYDSSHGRRGRKPSERYLGLLLRGARHHGLPPGWLRHLESLDRARDERSPGR